MSGDYAHESPRSNDNTQWMIDLALLEKENGIPVEDIRAHLSWVEKPGDLSNMELAHRYKRASGLLRINYLIQLIGRYAKPA